MEVSILMLTGAVLFGMALASWILKSLVKIPNPGVRRNKRKEKKLFQVILTDMEKNPGNWIQHGFSPTILSTLTLINDKKNMAIVYGDKEGYVKIYFNLKDVTLFHIEDSDTIITTITGRHATKFLKTATYLLDHRGKELNYFTERLEKRL